ncbi:MAG: polysaccharide biosynthesis tyrosine autokinase [Proteobacteria bacterium]|nr:polysaccharide biosynthesis tyrosine autokinase [Pseudomonadota bacterium]
MTEQHKNTTSASADGGSSDEIDLRDLFALLVDEWRWIAAITLAVFFVAAVYAFTTTPVFRTNALVQVEEKDTGIGGIEELSSMLSGETPTEAEIEIIKSRSVLTKAIEQRDLNIDIEPSRFPLIGGMIARRYEGEGAAHAWLGFDSHAWGGERVQIDRLDVDRGLEGESLTLIAGSADTYTLLDPEGELLLAGVVGEAASGNGMEMFVAELVAHEGVGFTVTRQDTLDTLDGLRERLSVAERGKKTGILELALEGEDRAEIARTLDTITNIYLRQNVERKSAEAAKTLEFLNEQMPELRAELNVAEGALNRFRVEKGSVDLSLETQALLEQFAEVEKQLSELELTRVERAQRFTAEHPAMQAMNQQRAELEQLRAQLEQQIRELPQAEQDALRLMRDVRVANELYTLLLNRAQELKVVQAGTVGNVRIIDTAFVPRVPVKPKKALVLALGLVLGGMLGVFAVFLRQALTSGIRDPKILEQHFGLPVYAIVPRSDAELHIEKTAYDALRLIALQDPNDPAVESLRSLRTSLEFLLRESNNNVLTIGGPAPGVGKSFICSNLAALMAQAGRRVLVVDADMRRGHLHRKFQVPRAPGLSQVIAGEVAMEDAITTGAISNLDFMASGQLPPNPAELLVSRSFETMLEALKARYDLVLLDAPPVLAASEAVTLARLAGLNLLVVRSGEQNRREVELAVDRLTQAGAAPKGFVFNGLMLGSRRYAYAGYRYYRYEQAV